MTETTAFGFIQICWGFGLFLAGFIVGWYFRRKEE